MAEESSTFSNNILPSSRKCLARQKVPPCPSKEDIATNQVIAIQVADTVQIPLTSHNDKTGSGSFWCLEGREVGLLGDGTGAALRESQPNMVTMKSPERRSLFVPEMMLRLGGCPGGARRVRRVVLAVDAAPDGRSSRLRRSWGVSGGPERRSQVAWWSDSWEFDQI